jgi:hypothetical protein
MRLARAFFVILGLGPSAWAQVNDSTCSIVDCVAGTQVVTHASTSEPFYSCATRELAEYTNTVLSFLVMQKMLGGGMPNVSDKTGEPEYTGESKVMLDTLRKNAGVSTFDEALSRCKVGLNRRKVMVLNDPKDSVVMWVATTDKQTYWMPKSAADRK